VPEPEADVLGLIVLAALHRAHRRRTSGRTHDASSGPPLRTPARATPRAAPARTPAPRFSRRLREELRGNVASAKRLAIRRPPSFARCDLGRARKRSRAEVLGEDRNRLRGPRRHQDEAANCDPSSRDADSQEIALPAGARCGSSRELPKVERNTGTFPLSGRNRRRPRTSRRRPSCGST
jgi:hypothetical protein